MPLGCRRPSVLSAQRALMGRPVCDGGQRQSIRKNSQPPAPLWKQARHCGSEEEEFEPRCQERSSQAIHTQRWRESTDSIRGARVEVRGDAGQAENRVRGGRGRDGARASWRGEAAGVVNQAAAVQGSATSQHQGRAPPLSQRPTSPHHDLTGRGRLA